MRPWLLIDAFDIPFEEQLVSLGEPNLSERLSEFSDSARVPVLITELDQRKTTVWDSLAICEFVSEHYLEGRAWPSGIADRALARSITAEMHSGFAALRNELPMNIRANRDLPLSSGVLADIKRIDDIWSRYARPDGNGDLRLFGEFSIADCFYAPVVMRFLTYQVTLSNKAAAYRDSIRAHPSVNKWCQSALLETEIVEDDEAGLARD